MVLILPLDVVYDIPVKGKVYPARTWKLIQSDGEFHTEESSYLKSCSETARTFVFERGDVVDINYNEQVHNKSHVDKGTHLLTFSSMMHRLDVQRAQNEKNIQNSRLRAGATPDRMPDILSAKENVELSRSNEKLAQLNFDRLEELYSEGVISKLELDVQLNKLEVARQQTKMAEQTLEGIRFGQKPEDLDVFKTAAKTAANELEVLQSRMDSYSVSAPWSGYMEISPEIGIVLQMTDTAQKVLVFPVDRKQMKFISKNAILLDAQSEEVLTTVFEIESESHPFNGRQVSMGMARVDKKALDIGLFKECVVRCDTIRLREYLKRKLL